MIRGIQLKDKDQWGKLFIDLKKEIYQLWENNLKLLLLILIINFVQNFS